MPLYGFGARADMGLGSKESNRPLIVPLEDGSQIQDLSCGHSHALLLLKDRTVLGSGITATTQDQPTSHETDSSEKPTPGLVIIKALNKKEIAKVSCGSAHSVALSRNGHLYSWGSNKYGQLGLQSNLPNNFGSSPGLVNLSEVVDAVCGDNHTLCLTSEGTLYAWGHNNHGQLGIGTSVSESRPKAVRSLIGIPFHSLAAGESHSIVVSVSGSVFSWGSNEFGQLGYPEKGDFVYPRQIKTLRYLFITQVFCGGSHSVALSKDGRVLTFGADSFGQLGHGKREDESLPKVVLELTGSYVSEVACGRCHTLVLVNRKVYSFGLGSSGQLGLDHPSNRLTPTLIPEIGQAENVFAGDDRSFVVTSSPFETKEICEKAWMKTSGVSRIDLEVLSSLVTSGSPRLPGVLGLLEDVTSSCTSLNASFLLPNYESFGCNKSNHGINMDDVREAHELIMETRPYVKEECIRVMRKALAWGVLPELTSSPPAVEAMRLYLILPWLPPFSDPKYYHSVHVPFGAAILGLDSLPRQILEHWWSSLKIRHFNRLLKVFKSVVTYILETEEIDCRVREFNQVENDLTVPLEVLAILNKINVETGKLPFEAFYVHSVVGKLNITEHYMAHALSFRSFSICRYPFILNAEAKTKILLADVNFQVRVLMEETARQNLLSRLFHGHPDSPFFNLRIDRNNILNDALSQLLNADIHNSGEMKKPIKVEFAGEEADDAGGVKKEFFMLLFQQMFSQTHGMFVEHTESRLIWFSIRFFQEALYYELAGLLCGLAIYNGVLVNVGFPLALCKKLIDRPTTLEDLKELDPTQGRSLESLQEYEGTDVEDLFCLNFTVSTRLENFDTTITDELVPGGADIPVTSENKQEFIDKMVDYYLNKSVLEQFNAFEKGFHKAVTLKIIRIFQPQELREMMCGNEHYDWDEFETGTTYSGEYWRHHPVIKAFWEAFHELSEDDKINFLLFLTGSARIPLLGMSELKMTIQPVDRGDEFFPVAHTCFNLLDLPKITDPVTMKKRLETAVQHNTGFSLV